VNNVSKSGEGQWTYLRINFHTPPVGKSGTGSLLFPDLKDPNAVFIKELTLKNKDKRGENNHLRLAEKKIKDLIKKAKVQVQEEDEKKDAEDFIQTLQMIQGRKETLENVVIKPNLEGRKTFGNLEVHKNGVSYVSTKGFRVDIPFSNMKHAFFQPCASDELVAIIHFTLKQPITMSNKKITDLQFFKESGVVADDIDMRGGRRMNDLDELELEERERLAKKKLTSKFH
jgi:nucleosome binding factor SPN SPT16 subunit